MCWCEEHERDLSECLEQSGITIAAMQKRSWQHAERSGFHDSNTGTAKDHSQRLMLIVSELAEALEELRAGHAPDVLYYKGDKPEGFGMELADAAIRLGDLAEIAGVDLDNFVQLKMAYNETRPHRHGGKAF